MRPMKKRCTKCGELCDLGEFRIRKSGNLEGSCKKCRTLYHIQWHHRTKEDRRSKILKYKQATFERAWNFVVDYLRTHPCVDCGEPDPLVLEFDHVRGAKRGVISNMIRTGVSTTTLEIEIEKCEVRCANCHRRKTAKQFGWKKILTLNLRS
jgi:hypothetical protein